MTTTTPRTTAAEPTTKAARPPHDLRTFWRRTLAVLLPLPLLSIGVSYLLGPTHENGSFADSILYAENGQGMYELRNWVELPFLVGMVPACLAAAWVARRGAPVLATIAAVLTALGFGAGFAGNFPGDRPMAMAIVELGLDRGTVEQLNSYMWQQPIANLAIGLFLLGGVMIGSALLGIALWRSRVVPFWFGWRYHRRPDPPVHAQHDPRRPGPDPRRRRLRRGQLVSAQDRRQRPRPGSEPVALSPGESGPGSPSGRRSRRPCRPCRRTCGGGDGSSCTPRNRSFSPPGTVRM